MTAAHTALPAIDHLRPVFGTIAFHAHAHLTNVKIVAVLLNVRVLVTGATGFIGRRLLMQLVRRFGARSIACLVHQAELGTEKLRRATLSHEGVRLIPGDLTEPSVAAESPPPVDVVFHLAANIDTHASERAAQVNDVGTANLLAWLGDRVNNARLVYASSVAVCDRDRRANGPLDESSPCRPRTHYGRTKLRAEQIIETASSRLHFSYTILRLPTVYGPGQKAGGMFDLLVRYAREGSWLGRLNWPGRTSIVYVDDVAEIMIDLAGMREAANQTFCVATDESLTIGEIARRVGALAGHTVAPIDLSPEVWRAVRWTAWNPAVAALMPPSARVAHWRLGLIADDGFWQSGAKLRRIYPRTLIALDDGVRMMLSGDQSRDSASELNAHDKGEALSDAASSMRSSP